MDSFGKLTTAEIEMISFIENANKNLYSELSKEVDAFTYKQFEKRGYSTDDFNRMLEEGRITGFKGRIYEGDIMYYIEVDGKPLFTIVVHINTSFDESTNTYKAKLSFQVEDHDK